MKKFSLVLFWTSAVLLAIATLFGLIGLGGIAVNVTGGGGSTAAADWYLDMSVYPFWTSIALFILGILLRLTHKIQTMTKSPDTNGEQVSKEVGSA